MANPEHVELIRAGVNGWNAWSVVNWDVRPDLGEVDLSGADLSGARLIEAWLSNANLSGANLSGANLSKANLTGANLSSADLSGADLGAGAFISSANLSGANLCGANLAGSYLISSDLSRANLSRANLAEADLCGADLRGANLSGANLSGANLISADLSRADLSRADLSRATLVGCRLSATTMIGARVYGTSVWDVETDDKTEQTGLIITPKNEPTVMVDDLEVSQVIYLLLNREKIRNVIDAVTQRGVLLLGRFGDNGLVLLQTIAAWLRKPENGGYLPLLFDFPRPKAKTYTETVRTLAGLARFVIVDLSGPSVPQEITATVDLYEIPFVPILEQNREDWSMFRDFLVKEHVLEPIRFADQDHLLDLLAEEVIAPAEKLIEKRQKRLDKIFGRA